MFLHFAIEIESEEQVCNFSERSESHAALRTFACGSRATVWPHLDAKDDYWLTLDLPATIFEQTFSSSRNQILFYRPIFCCL